jgi:hypothetical protein
MRSHAKALVLVVLWLVGLTIACAGSGEGLDEFGNPLGEGGGGELQPTFSSIQANIFTPICTQCHAGASAPLSFSLQAGFSYDHLVGVPSIEVPELLRVDPGQPDDSYLVMKIEGAPGITGGRMPLGLSPLSAEQIAAIRAWIADGALEN